MRSWMEDICDAQKLLDEVIEDLNKHAGAFDVLKMDKLRNKTKSMAASVQRANMYIDGAVTKIDRKINATED